MSERGSDAEVIAASLEAPERFAEIFDRHYSAVRGYLPRRIDSFSADDLAAETFVVALRRREAYDRSQANARPWLLGIAVNLLHRERRQERRQLRAYARAVDERGPSANEDRHSFENALAPELARALLKLSLGDREVLFLYACADLTYEQIAVAVGIPTGTVRSRLSRARRQVRELLEAEGAIPKQATLSPGPNR